MSFYTPKDSNRLIWYGRRIGHAEILSFVAFLLVLDAITLLQKLSLAQLLLAVCMW